MKFFLFISHALESFLNRFTDSRNRTLTPFNPTISHVHGLGIGYGARESIADLRRAERNVITRPLRVVQIQDRGPSGKHFGRLIISGKMSDVCAELDRLAALEIA